MIIVQRRRLDRSTACCGVLRAIAAGAAIALALAAEASLNAAGDQSFQLSPSLTLSDLGLDTNILASPETERRDATGNLQLQVEPAFTAGRVRVTGRAATRFAYFREYPEERSLDADSHLKAAVRLNRLTVYGAGSFLRTRDRFDPEIYVRPQRVEASAEAGGALRLTGKTRVDFAGRWATVQFAATQSVGAGLRQTLNREIAGVTTALRDEVTRLTTIVLTGAAQRERFAFMTARDATALTAMAGVEFKPGALLDGKAYVGYREFSGLHERTADAGGIVASVDLGHTLGESLRVSARMERDLAHSFRVRAPYFTSTLFGVEITKRLTRAWDVTGSAARERLDYRRALFPSDAVIEEPFPGADGSVAEMLRYAGGATYRLNANTTVGFTADYYRWRTDLTRRQYDRLRLVSSVIRRF